MADDGIRGCGFPEYINFEVRSVSNDRQVKKADSVVLFGSGAEFEVVVYDVGVVCNSIQVDLGCVIDYEDVVYVSCVEDDTFVSSMGLM